MPTKGENATAKMMDLFCGTGSLSLGFDDDFIIRLMGFVTPDGHTDWIAYYAWQRENAIRRADAWLNHRCCEGLWDNFRIRVKYFQEEAQAVIIRSREAWLLIRGGGIMGNGRIESTSEILPLPPTGNISYVGIVM